MKKQLLLLLYATGITSSLLASTTVQLIDHITIRAPYVELGEIATIETGNQSIKEKLQNLVVSDAPQVNKTKTISSYTINHILKEQGISTPTILGSQTTVSTEDELVSTKDIKMSINQWIKEKIDEKTTYEVEFVKLPTNWKVPLLPNKEVLVSYGKGRLKQNISLKLSLVHHESVFSTTHARIHLKLYKDLPVTTQAISRGEVLTQHHLEFKKTEITNSIGMELASTRSIIGMEARRSIKQGAVLTAKDLTPRTLVERGSFNRIIILNGKVKMVVSGAQALENGREGEFILFTNPLNKYDRLKAKVMRSGLAMIKLK